MRVVPLTDRHRRKHFDFFRNMNHPHFSICATVDVRAWVEATKARGIRLTSSLVYLLAHAANSVPQFRWRLRDDTIVEHDLVHPSFTVTTDDSDAFSFCEVDFDWAMAPFIARADASIEARRTEPSFEDEEGRDDYLFMSALPWIAFTSVTHAMSFHPHDSVPRITWGKLTENGGALTMPVSVQAHHALVDGAHMGALFRAIETLAASPQSVMEAVE